VIVLVVLIVIIAAALVYVFSQGAFSADLEIDVELYLYVGTSDSDTFLHLTGRVYNLDVVEWTVVMDVVIWDDRGWEVSDRINLGTIQAADYRRVDETYDWPYYYGGQYADDAVAYWSAQLEYE
jgi:hypothetical protein